MYPPGGKALWPEFEARVFSSILQGSCLSLLLLVLVVMVGVLAPDSAKNVGPHDEMPAHPAAATTIIAAPIFPSLSAQNFASAITTLSSIRRLILLPIIYPEDREVTTTTTAAPRLRDCIIKALFSSDDCDFGYLRSSLYHHLPSPAAFCCAYDVGM